VKLSEVKTAGNLKILLLGAPGSGKTCFAASLPYPMLYLDFDNKVDSAALFHKGDLDRLEGIDVRDLSPSIATNPIAALEKIIREELIPQEKSGGMKFKTIVLDSITTFSSATLKHIVDSNPGVSRSSFAQGKQPGLQDFGILKREFIKLIPGLLALPCNVVMCAHVETFKDANSGVIIRSPMMDGSFSEMLPVYFKEVWHCYVTDKGEFLAQTKADTKFSCLRSQIPGLANPMPLKYSELEKYLR
jgi:hypothetical protein